MGHSFMPLSPLDAGVTLFCLSLSAFLYHYHKTSCNCISDSHPQARGYILENQVTHARLLPIEASHAFTYPSLTLLVSVDALESHKLDLGNGWVFGYGGLWGRLVGLRTAPYFASGSREHETISGKNRERTLRNKLEGLLVERGLIQHDGEQLLQDVWMMTMPSFLGYEGINPLTVYFCYKTEKLWATVLEIHNTFGETHVHVLEVGQNEDEVSARPKGFDHQWTFPREFHVSPFNDRSGFYTVSVKSPSHPPIPLSTPCNPPRPTVRVHLHTSSDTPGKPDIPGPLKLSALLRPIASYPLTTKNLLRSLARAPFELFLSMPRILIQSWTLHYRKRLDVFIRPEPLPPATKLAFSDGTRRGGGVKWLSEKTIERFARVRVESYLRRKVEEVGVSVSLVAADPTVPDLVFQPKDVIKSEPIPELIVTYLSPRFFTILFACPSPEHALLVGRDTENVFDVNSPELFVAIFSCSPTPSASDKISRRSRLQRLRIRPIPASVTLPVPATHPLDFGDSLGVDSLMTRLALQAILFLERFERWAFSVARARVVEGEEPWEVWGRAGRVAEGKRETELLIEKEWGSVRRRA